MNQNKLIETIKIENGEISNIKWHNLRFNRTRKELFGIDNSIDLEDFIKIPINKGLFCCRILYNREIVSIESTPYKAKLFKTFKIVESDIEYMYKYENRMSIEKLKAEAFPYNEIIMKKEGLLTDTSIANIAFYNGEEWITPKKPLLKGTMRANLLESNQLIEKDIKEEELNSFSHFALMNAMIGFQIQKNIIIQSQKEKLCL